MTEEEEKSISAVESQLKFFQSETVKFVVDKLTNDNETNKVLIADEVGLGKTIIAKGIIAALIKNRKDGKPLHVVYICSNKILAHTNIKKLNPFSNTANSISRLSFLASVPDDLGGGALQLSSLTPNTSFRLTRSVGIKEERALIYKLLIQYKFFREYKAQLKNLLQGNNSITSSNWDELITKFEKGESNNQMPRKGVAKRFKEKLENTILPQGFCKAITEFLGLKKEVSVFETVKLLLKALKGRSIDKYEKYWYEIIIQLRKGLTEICTGYLEADLFILDEFQRFKTLIDTEEESEAGVIAKKILQDDQAKVVLLSATPFKPYTTQIEELVGENHQDELKRIVKYLGGAKGGELWKEFNRHQKGFFDVLSQPIEAYKNLEESVEVKNQLQKTFKKFMSRNERLNVAHIKDNMTKTIRLEEDNIDIGDIENFIALDSLVNTMVKVKPSLSRNFGSTLEFSKSAPYSLSYLYGYNLHKNLFDSKTDPLIKAKMRDSSKAFLNLKDINEYKPVGQFRNEPNYPNPKFRALAKECFGNKSELLLWVPPIKTYYKPEGVFENQEDFSKILIFSSWVMVPRAISTLITYEAERRTIAKESLEGLKETVVRSYFDQTRRPSPLLRFSHRENGKLGQIASLVLTYPSQSLIFNGDMLNDLTSFNQTGYQVKSQIKKRLKIQFDELKIKETYSKNKNIDSSWVWLAGPLLDKINNTFDDTIDFCISMTSGVEKEHYEYLKDKVNKVFLGKINLGKFPKDLFDKLAKIALAAPSNSALYALNKIYEGSDWLVKKEQSFLIAQSFRSLFNRPESISAVRLAEKNQKDYWEQVLNYSLSGNITSMLEEYIYLLKDSENIPLQTPVNEENIANYFQDILGVIPSPINVDLRESVNSYKQHKMRCHFAMSFGGNTGTSSDEKTTRSINVRSLFNSPFRPFVLSSTSIGQEGLDFHYYCRKIFHWNLPHNAIDIEQREGRINRYKSFAIRKRIEESSNPDIVLKMLKEENVPLWKALFDEAENTYKDRTEIKPFWYLDEGKTQIERFVPIHKLSRDNYKYEQLNQILALYRLTFGQPRQEELIEALRNAKLNDSELQEIRESLLLNLSSIKNE